MLLRIQSVEGLSAVDALRKGLTGDFNIYSIIYSGDLNAEQVRISNGKNQSGYWMIKFLDAIINWFF